MLITFSTLFALLRRRRMRFVKLSGRSVKDPLGPLISPGYGAGIASEMRYTFGQRAMPAPSRALGLSKGFAAMATTTTEGRSMTIREFCEAEQISPATYHKLKRLDLAPDELRAPGCAFVRITQDARARWHERLARAQMTDTAQIEREHRIKAARRAGKLAAKSDRHISSRKRRACK